CRSSRPDRIGHPECPAPSLGARSDVLFGDSFCGSASVPSTLLIGLSPPFRWRQASRAWLRTPVDARSRGHPPDWSSQGQRALLLARSRLVFLATTHPSAPASRR